MKDEAPIPVAQSRERIYPMQPTFDEIREAFQEGFQSIDDGDSFYTGFNTYLVSIGCVKRDDIPCTCSDQGGHGHLPECRWVKA